MQYVQYSCTCHTSSHTCTCAHACLCTNQKYSRHFTCDPINVYSRSYHPVSNTSTCILCVSDGSTVRKNLRFQALLVCWPPQQSPTSLYLHCPPSLFIQSLAHSDQLRSLTVTLIRIVFCVASDKIALRNTVFQPLLCLRLEHVSMEPLPKL